MKTLVTTMVVAAATERGAAIDGLGQCGVGIRAERDATVQCFVRTAIERITT